MFFFQFFVLSLPDVFRWRFPLFLPRRHREILLGGLGVDQQAGRVDNGEDYNARFQRYYRYFQFNFYLVRTGPDNFEVLLEYSL